MLLFFVFFYLFFNTENQVLCFWENSVRHGKTKWQATKFKISLWLCGMLIKLCPDLRCDWS